MRVSALQLVSYFKTENKDLYRALLGLARQIDDLYKLRLTFNLRTREFELLANEISNPLGGTIFRDNVIIGPGITNAIINDAAKRYLTIIGVSNNGVLELASNKADALNNIIGQIQFVDKNSATKLGILIESILSGSTANNRGSSLLFYTKVDNTAILVERVRVDDAGGVFLGMNNALGVSSIDGFVNISAISGVPTGTPNLKTGQIPILADTDHDRLYQYSSGRWNDIGIRTDKLTADQASSVTALADAGIEFSVKAGRYYKFEFDVVFQTDNVGTGIHLSIETPIAAAGISYMTNIQTTSQVTFRLQGVRVSNGGTATAGVDIINSVCPAKISGVLKNGVNAGLLKLRFASGVGGSVATLKPGTMGWIKEI